MNRIILLLAVAFFATACVPEEECDGCENNHGYGYEYDWQSPTYGFYVRGDFERRWDYADIEEWYRQTSECLGLEPVPAPGLLIVLTYETIVVDEDTHEGYAWEYPPLIVVDATYPSTMLRGTFRHEFIHYLMSEWNHEGDFWSCQWNAANF